MTHRIRLGPPWLVTTADGRTRHARKFGRPRTLDAGERVWLVSDALPGPAAVFLNGEPVGAAPGPRQPFSADITSRLQPRNEVVFETPAWSDLGGVAIEIRSPGE